MFYVTKTYGHEMGLSACFRQWRAESHCRFLHGYALSFTVKFAARNLDKNGWVIDFGGLKDLKAFLAETFDHKLLVDVDDPARQFLTGLGDVVDGHSVDRSWQIHDKLADVLVLPGVGCEAFAGLVYDWVTDWLGDTDQADRVILHSVECREHSGNAAIRSNVYLEPINGR